MAYKMEVFQTAEELNQAAAELIMSLAKKSIAARGRFSLALSGGETPQHLYKLLAKSPFHEMVEWKNTFIFWGDERFVPVDDEQNNAHQAEFIWLNHSAIPKGHIHPIAVNLSPREAALSYQKDLQDFFGENLLRFDLILLGLGENGHTASLFPGTKVLDEKKAGVKDVFVEQEKRFRITMTAPLINQARNILFLVTGEKKAAILERVIYGTYEPKLYPAQLINPKDGHLYWFVDRAAASLLGR